MLNNRNAILPFKYLNTCDTESLGGTSTNK